jgi:predicted permease
MLASFRRFGFLLRRGRLARELDEEMRLHEEERARRIASEGVTEAEARREARLRFGNRTRAAERSFETWGWTWLDRLAQDMRYALRVLRRSPVFTASAVLTLALGIGANAAIFSVMYGLLWRPLPVKAPERLVQYGLRTTEFQAAFSYPAFEAIRKNVRAVEGLFTWNSSEFKTGWGVDAREVKGAVASGDVFRTLGVTARVGRLFGQEDDQAGAPLVCVIGDGYWASEFNRDPHVIGRGLTLDGRRLTVIGVMPAEFYGIVPGEEPDVIVPVHTEAAIYPERNILTEKGAWYMLVFGRLRSGFREAQAQAEARAISKTIAADAGWRDMVWMDARGRQTRKADLDVRPGASGYSWRGGHFRDAMFALMGISALVLLAACLNLANLMLSRAAAREREMSLRAALGAGRVRLVRQLFTESVLLTAAGAGLGFALAAWANPALLRFLDLAVDLHPDLRVAAALGLLCAATSILFGLVPAIRGTQVEPNDALKCGRIGIGSGRRWNLAKMLVPAQAALSVVLLATALLYVRTLENLRWQNLGFDRDQVLVAQIQTERAGMNSEQETQFAGEVLERVRALPFVQAASATGIVPIGGGWHWNNLPAELYPNLNTAERTLYGHRVAPDYFRAMGTKLLLGRDFTDRDAAANGVRPALLNQRAARTYFPRGDAVGRVLRIDKGTQYRVIGVVEDAKYANLRDEAPRTIYTEIDGKDGFGSSWNLVIRTRRDSALAAPAVRSILKATGKDVTMGELHPMSKQIDDALRTERLVATLASFFAVLAGALLAIGLYGVLSYTVARRTSEIGVRLALGATRRGVLWMMLGDALSLAVLGTVAGVPAAVGCGRLVASQLYGVTPWDPAMLGLTIGLLIAVSLAAAFAPAWRASRLDPMRALHYE